MTEKLTVEDYPLSERRPELVSGRQGRALGEITLESVMAGEIDMEDLRITADALRRQAEIAGAAGRPRLAENLQRAAELADVPQELIMEIYELLRPGRATDKGRLVEAARRLRQEHGAERAARFIEEAAEVYERRGLFTYRF